jgi:hypothetical protein
MKKNQKNIVIAAVVVAVVALGAIFFTQSGLLQGWFKFSNSKTTLTRPSASYYRTNLAKFVTLVASPVTSPVSSTVTSPSGPSTVVSPVTSPVVSAVELQKAALAGVDTSKLPLLTAADMKAAARADFLRNPAKYQLTAQQRKQFIDLYNAKKNNVKGTSMVPVKFKFPTK